MHSAQPTTSSPSVPPSLLGAASGIDVQTGIVSGSCAALAVVAMAQLALGADPVLVALSVTSILIGMGPLVLYGVDLYTCLAALFSFRYTGAALLLKTAYGQPLDTYLQAPLTTYWLVNLLMLAEVAAILIARRFDKGRSIFPRLSHRDDLRAIGLASFVIGTVSLALNGLMSSRLAAAGDTGAAHVVTNTLGGLVFFGLVAEVSYNVHNTRGWEFFSRRLAVMLGIALLITLFLNGRGLLLNCAIAVFVAALLFKAIRVRHVVIGSVLGALFTLYVSPVALEMRLVKEERSATNFAIEAVGMLGRAIAEPAYAAELRTREAFRSRYESGTALYDYFGDGSNIANRLAFVALLDAVAYQMKVIQPLGQEAVEQVLNRVYPKFLGNKVEYAYGHGDWLTWQLGLIENGRVSYFSFGLPMEGYATFGIWGLTMAPFVFITPLLLIMGRISTLRQPLAASLFLFCAFQWQIFEGQSETFVALLTRSLPLTVPPLFLLYWLRVQRRPGT